jgi:hypothetical protein
MAILLAARINGATLLVLRIQRSLSVWLTVYIFSFEHCPIFMVVHKTPNASEVTYFSDTL